MMDNIELVKIFLKINNLIEEFITKEGRFPEKIHIPTKILNKLIELPITEITINGPQKYFENSFFGMKPIWDAKELKVE